MDDKLPNRLVLEGMLRPEGFLLQSAASGQEALDLVAQQAPDLILLDVLMPGMDGYQVVGAIKGNPATKNRPRRSQRQDARSECRRRGLAGERREAREDSRHAAGGRQHDPNDHSSPGRSGTGLDAVPPSALDAISISPAGDALSWPSLHVDVYVPGLVERAFGTRLFARATGQRGGQRRSKAKAAAARANGARGGRPRKRLTA